MESKSGVQKRSVLGVKKSLHLKMSLCFWTTRIQDYRTSGLQDFKTLGPNLWGFQIPEGLTPEGFEH